MFPPNTASVSGTKTEACNHCIPSSPKLSSSSPYASSDIWSDMNSSSLDIAGDAEGVDGPTGVNLLKAGLGSGSVCSAAFRFRVEATVVMTKGAEARCLDLGPNNDTTYSCTSNRRTGEGGGWLIGRRRMRIREEG